MKFLKWAGITFAVLSVLYTVGLLTLMFGAYAKGMGMVSDSRSPWSGRPDAAKTEKSIDKEGNSITTEYYPSGHVRSIKIDFLPKTDSTE